MAAHRVLLQSSGHSCLKQWWKRSCSKIWLLLVWHALFVFSLMIYVLSNLTSPFSIVFSTSVFVSYSFAPLIGWLADVRFGRYGVIKFGSIASAYFVTLQCSLELI